MGNYTNWSLEMIDTTTSKRPINSIIVELGKYAYVHTYMNLSLLEGNSTYDKWYDEDPDMKSISEHFPFIKFCVSADPDEGDPYKDYWFNGLNFTANSQITYPECEWWK